MSEPTQIYGSAELAARAEVESLKERLRQVDALRIDALEKCERMKQENARHRALWVDLISLARRAQQLIRGAQ